MAANDKDTIYVDIDDEITTIIDKVRSSDGKIVALVLPKRASVFQSVVNMKLLKRTAESAKKHLVLVTTESSLMPLAGAVGLLVAATPQSKPEIPESPKNTDLEGADEEPITDDGEGYTASNAGDRSVDDLAGATGHVSPGDEAEMLPDDDEAAGDDKPAKLSKNRHLKVPNFNMFRLRLFLAGLLLVAAIVGLYICLAVLPRAVIAIKTNTSTINVNLAATLDSAATKLNLDTGTVPAKSEQQQKTTSQQINTTGKKKTGEAAAASQKMS